MSDMELNNNMDELEDAEDLGPITLVDENNEEHQFELIDTVKYEGYVCRDGTLRRHR